MEDRGKKGEQASTTSRSVDLISFEFAQKPILFI